MINLIEHAMIYANSDYLDESMFPAIRTNYDSFPSYESARESVLEKFKRDYLIAILTATKGNVTQAAEKMDISRQGLIKMIKALNISAGDFLLNRKISKPGQPHCNL